MKKLSKGMLMAALICGSFVSAYGGETSVFAAEAGDEALSSFSLEQIVVTATRTMEEAKKVPAMVSVVTAEDIKKKNVKTVSDALTMLPGVYNARTHGMSETANGIEIRGFGENNILFLYDGMPMNDAYDGGMNWNAISVEDVERIEVVRGAASSLYGGHAVAAVVNIISKDPEKDSVRAYASYGTKNTWKRGISVSKKLSDKFSMGVGYEHKRTSGWMKKYAYASTSAAKSASPSGTEATGVQQVQRASGSVINILGTPGSGASRDDTYNLKLKYKFDADKYLMYRYTHDKYRYFAAKPDSWLVDANGNHIFEGSVKFSNGKYYNFDESDFTDYNGHRKVDRHALQYKDEKNKIDLNIGFTDVKDNGYSTGSDLAGNGPGNDSRYPNKSYKIDFQKVWENKNNTLVAGFDVQRNKMDYIKNKLLHWHKYKSVTSNTSQMGGSDLNLAVFVQDDYKFSKKFGVNMGLRMDHYKKYDGYYKDKTTHIDQLEKSYTELSPKLAVEFTPRDDTTVYVSYGHSFNPPRLYQLYRHDPSYGYIANPDLEPETTNTFEIGVKKSFGKKTNAALSIFRSKTKDLISATPKDSEGHRKYVNIDKAKRLGVELEINHHFNKALSGYFNYAYVNAKDGTGERLWSIPRHVMHTGIRYEKDKWNAYLEGQYISRRDTPDYIGNHFMADDSFFVANVGVNYNINPHAMISFSVDNLFDRDYWQWYKAQGRVYTVGVQFEF